MNRRGFLRAALGASVGVVIATPALVEALHPNRTIYLPPAGGWISTKRPFYNAGLPSFLTNYVDPQMIEVLVHPMKMYHFQTHTQWGSRA